jgi:hypothetical protein
MLLLPRWIGGFCLSVCLDAENMKGRVVSTIAEPKKLDQKGRLSLGKDYAGKLVTVRQIAEGVWQVVLSVAVPAPEAWLHENPEAIASVMRGMKQAAEGQTVPGPDLDAATAFADTIEDE